MPDPVPDKLTDEERAQQIVDALTDEAIAAVSNVAVKAMILAIRTARPEFTLSESNEERLAQIGLAAALAARGSVSPNERERELEAALREARALIDSEVDNATEAALNADRAAAVIDAVLVGSVPLPNPEEIADTLREALAHIPVGTKAADGWPLLPDIQRLIAALDAAPPSAHIDGAVAELKAALGTRLDGLTDVVIANVARQCSLLAPSRHEGDEEAVERVAKALKERLEAPVYDRRDSLLADDLARAAIAAFREPVARGETE